MDKKSNHQANVVQITEIKPHTNADTLAIIPVGGYQAVVKKDEFKVGDLAVYIQPDSVVPQTEPFKFIWENYEGLDGVVPEKRRRITVRKFRGEWSEGLLLPAKDFNFPYDVWKEGDDISDFLGITHYDPDKGRENTGDFDKHPRKKRGRPKSLRGWFWYLVRFLGIYGEGGKSVSGWDTEDGGKYAPVYDVEALKNYADAFNEGEEVFVTEKIHGSNARYLYLDGHMYAGSRTQWKAETSHCIWRKALKFNPWIEEWCKANEGYILYGEVTPTQGDKWTYGSKDPQFFAFDIYTPEGEWINPLELSTLPHYFQTVPLLYREPFNLERIKKHVDGPSTMENGPAFREGIVVAPAIERHIHGLGRLKLKLVSSEFLAKDSK